MARPLVRERRAQWPPAPKGRRDRKIKAPYSFVEKFLERFIIDLTIQYRFYREWRGEFWLYDPSSNHLAGLLRKVLHPARKGKIRLAFLF